MMNVFFKRFTHVVFISLLLLAPVGLSQGAQDTASTVTRLKGAAFAMQDAIPRPLKVGSQIQRGDVISTGPGARLEMKMLDDAVMTLGEKPILVVIDYIAGGAEPNAAMRLLEGAFSATTGKMMQVASAKFTLETPSATIGIHGTTFWGGKLDGKFEVALLDGKAIIIANKAGRVVLDKINEGTAITDANTPPTKPKVWGGKKIDRAIVTVAF